MTEFLICGNSLSWLLNCTQTLETVKWVRKWVVIFFNPRKASHISFRGSSNHGAVNVTVFPEEKGPFLAVYCVR